MKTNYIIFSCIFALLVGSLSSCLKKSLNEAETKPPVEEFDFATAKPLSVNLDLALTDYAVLVEFYIENPVKEVFEGEYSSFVKDESIKPVLRSITKKDGTLTDIVSLPTGTKTVYLYTNYIGLPLITPIEVKNGEVALSLKKKDMSKAFATRAITRASHSIPEGIMVIGDWADNGIPNYLEPERNLYPAKALYSLNKAIFYTTNGGFVGMEYLNDNFNTNINIIKETAVNLSYLGGSASMQNTLCYYHYPTDQKPTYPSEAKLIVAFPNSTFPTLTYTGLSSGDNMMLKYWNSETNRFEDNFPAGVTISFAILPNSFKRTTGGNIALASSADKVFFSQPALNVNEEDGARSHCILFNDVENECFTFLFEDLPRKGKITDIYPGGDFRDAMIYIKATSGAINTDNIPNLPDAGLTTPDESENISSREGTLIFEDLWPSEGDYDMNDVVVEYTSLIYRTGDGNNRVLKVVDQFTPIHNGGNISVSFGYQFDNATKGQLSCVTEPALASPSVFAIDAAGMEMRQNKATIIVSEDIRASLGKTITVTTTCLASQASSSFMPPYNPFIIINKDGARGDAEVHLTGHIPTNLANIALFGTFDDNSDINVSKYYISKNGTFPFAMNIPIRGFKWATEMTRIDEEYPRFKEWVSSGGTESTDWYL